MTSKIVVHVNGNYRVPVYKGNDSSNLGTPEYVGPGSNITKDFPLHTGDSYFVGAEEAYDEAATAIAEAEQKSDGEDSDPE